MQVMVTFRHVKPTTGLRQHAESKLKRVQKFVRAPIEAHVILSVIKHRHTAELQVNADHLMMAAAEETDDLYSAIDLAVSKIERQMKKRVDKYKERKRTAGAATVVARPARREPGSRIQTRRVAVKPMSVDEAVIELRRSKSDFLLFRNAANDCVSVLYRRKAGDYGLIEPEPS